MNIPSSKAWAVYERLSVDRHGAKIGYDVQDAGIDSYAEALGLVIGHRYIDRNETAADENVWRDEYEQMLADVAAGMWAGILVWRIDRLTRLPPQFERVLSTAQKAAGCIISTEEKLNSRVEADLFNMRLKVLMGDQEVQGTRTRLKANKGHKAKQGQYTGGGRRPFGFEGPTYDDSERVTNTGRCGIAHVDSEVTLLRDAAKRIAWGGESYTDVIKDWHSRTPPVYGAVGAPWNPKTLETIMLSHRMIGEQLWNDPDTGMKVPVPAVWKPVLDRKTWDQLNSMKRRAVHREGKVQYLLSSLINCECGYPLTGSTRKYKRGGVMTSVRTYRCRSMPADKARGACGQCSVLAENVESLIIGHVLLRVKRSRQTAAALREGGDSYQQLDALERQADGLSDELIELAGLKGERQITTKEWLVAKAPIERDLAEINDQMKAVSRRLEVPTPAGEEMKDLPAWFRLLSSRQQRKLIDHYTGSATIRRPGRSGRYFDRERVVFVPAKLEQSDGESD